MSKGTVNQVIQRAIGDAAFRRQLQSDPKKALAGFDLTADERSAITSGDPGKLTSLGVDQRMSKAFNLSGISAASASAVSPDLTGAGASAFIDEGTGGRGTSAIDTGGSGARTMAADGTSIDAGLVSGKASASVTGQGSSGLMAADGTSIDAGHTSALNTGASAFEEGGRTAAARQPVDASGDFNRLDPGIESNTREATAFEPADVSGDPNQLDPGYVSGDSAARTTDAEVDQTGLGQSGKLDAGGHTISE